MEEIFSSLKKKPVREKNRILYWTTFLVMAAVVIFWFFTFPNRFRENPPVTENTAVNGFLNSFVKAKDSTQQFFEGVFVSGQNYFK